MLSIDSLERLRTKLKTVTHQHTQIILVPHQDDDAQLRAPRKDEMACSEGKQCLGFRLKGETPSILKAWTPPPPPLIKGKPGKMEMGETEEFTASTARPCLLCLRSILYCFVTTMDAKSLVGGISPDVIEWPFRHEGYRDRALMCPSNDPKKYLGIRHPIVKPCLRLLVMRKDPKTGLNRVDQTSLFVPSHY